MFVSALDDTIASSEVQKVYANNVLVPLFKSFAKVNVTILPLSPGNYTLLTLADVNLVPEKVSTEKVGETFEITANSNRNLNFVGTYAVPFSLSDRGKKILDDEFVFKLVDLEDTLEINSSQNDLSSGKIVFYIINKQNTNIQDLEVDFSSTFFEKSEIFNLTSYEQKKFSYDLFPGKSNILAGSYILKAAFRDLKGHKKLLEGKIIVIAQKNIIIEDKSSGWIIKKHFVSKTNAGNTRERVIITEEKNLFTKLFTSFDVEPDSAISDGIKTIYSWDKQVEPGTSLIVTIRTNYFVPLALIIVIFLFVFGYKRYKESAVIVRKSIHPIRTATGDFALKIKLNIHAIKNIDKLTIIDSIPRMFKVYKDFGLIKPTKINVSDRRIHWSLGELKQGEERVVTYVLYSNIGVVGSFALPSAAAIYDMGKKVHEVRSNKVFFQSEQKHREE